MSKTATMALKSIAIILVILGHANIIYGAGRWGVTIFLFCSGYGLNRSYKPNGNITGMAVKRIKHIYFPYLFFISLQLIFEIIVKKELTVWNSIFSIFALDFGFNVDPSMWYVSYICVCYIIYYIYKECRSIKLSYIFLALMPVVLGGLALLNIIWSPSATTYVYFMGFPAGVFIAEFEKSIKRVNWKKLYLMYMLLCVIYVACQFEEIKHGLGLVVYNYIISGAIILLFPFVGNIVQQYSKQGGATYTKILYFANRLHVYDLFLLVGRYSYTIYLVEGFLFRNHSIFGVPDDKFLLFVFVLCISFIIGFLEDFVYSRIVLPYLT